MRLLIHEYLENMCHNLCNWIFHWQYWTLICIIYIVYIPTNYLSQAICLKFHFYWAIACYSNEKQIDEFQFSSMTLKLQAVYINRGFFNSKLLNDAKSKITYSNIKMSSQLFSDFTDYYNTNVMLQGKDCLKKNFSITNSICLFLWFSYTCIY